MEVKFTPWRMAYIKQSEGQTPISTDDEQCVLCALHLAPVTDDLTNLVLYRGNTCYVVMNLYPYNSGHLMVVSYQHTADLAQLDVICANELFHLSQQCVHILTEAFHPHGFNLGMNLGRTAGAGIADHLHMHIVPRWNGDTNFMPLVGGTKLIPVELQETYAQLRPHFDQLPSTSTT
ncbi:MAG: HIT domain-containing protein [Chloroflexaceae bacterium]|nr:HIT domain-containing protein [Chloroflexaceae bacterium]